MGLFNNFMAESLVVLGFILLVIEITVLGFSLFILFFIGLGCIITGVLMFMGLLNESLATAFLSTAVLTFLSAIALWKPLKKIQNPVAMKPARSDLIGHSFILDQDVSPSGGMNYRYSGITWKVVSDENLAAGTEVEVIRADVGTFTVAPKT